jgi:hypothetical protein
MTVVSQSVIFYGARAPGGPWPPHYRGFIITLRYSTLDSTPLDEGSARRRELYLTIHNTHNRQTSILQQGFQPALPANEQSQTHNLDHAATVQRTVRQLIT